MVDGRVNRALRIVAAPDSFKGSLSAKETAAAMKRGVMRAYPDARVDLIPIADGGEGTADALLEAVPGAELVRLRVSDPLGAPVDAEYAWLPDGTAVIELASASGIMRIPAQRRDALAATTYGTGELIRDALERGCRKLLIGLGGSATTDGGTGILRALGVRFLDADGKELKDGGGSLEELAAIDRSGIHPGLADAAIEVCCDVTNPLYGLEGAAYVYSSQKGADEHQVRALDRGLRRFAEVVEAETGSRVIHELAGGGAAGGTGGGLAALLGASLRPGFELIAGRVRLEAAIADADIVLTGEGRTDAQTLNGKVPFGVARIARHYRVPVAVISGSLGPGAEALYEHGISAMFSLTDGPMELSEAMASCAALAEKAAENAVRLFGAGWTKGELSYRE